MTYLKTIFQINKMDCPSDEQFVRMALSDFSAITDISVNLEKRLVEVTHQEKPEHLLQAINKLHLDAQIINSQKIEEPLNLEAKQVIQRFILWQVLIINLTFFLIEELAGYFFNSLALSADGLDMLADSLVYSLALMAVAKSVSRKKQVSAIAGYLQLMLALMGFGQVIYRVINHQYLPNGMGMMTIAIMALVANILSLYLISKADHQEVHMKATQLFTSNDILINVGVIVSSVLIGIFHSPIPDLIIGTLIYSIVIKSAYSIIQLSK
ncbi:cation transporter [Streptococcus hongkongensis]|nr:membrane protein [Streptococcus uberis]